MIRWQQSIRNVQNRFRIGLMVVRDAQLDAAEQRRYREKIEWRDYLKRLRDWRLECADRTCPDCGELKRWLVHESMEGREWWEAPERFETRLCCEGVPVVDFLARSLRGLAGINGGRASARTEWTGWHDSRPGFQSCGPDSWDNAVGAWEDDD